MAQETQAVMIQQALPKEAAGIPEVVIRAFQEIQARRAVVKQVEGETLLQAIKVAREMSGAGIRKRERVFSDGVIKTT